MSRSKETIKNILGNLPLTAEIYWFLRSMKNPLQGKYQFKLLHNQIAEICGDVKKLRKPQQEKQKVLLFATLHYWIENEILLGFKFAADGHDVTVAYLPFQDWFTPINKFDLKRQNVYTKKLFSKAEELIHPVSLLDINTTFVDLPRNVVEIVEEVSILDVQYTSQTEDVDKSTDLYKFRYHRNFRAAKALYKLLTENRPDRIIIGNGTIQEFGIAKRIARFLNIPTVTYEFSEQKDRVWLSQNDEVMRQNTDEMWDAMKETELNPQQLSKMQDLFEIRHKASTGMNFTFQWQKNPSKGGQIVKQELNLDDRPMVLLATNVIGDSLTLGRQVFSRSMAEWINRTIQYFIGRPEINLVIRVHPGETFLKGVSITESIQRELPKLPENIHLLYPDEKVNTYDLMSLADLGLVYTTTVGLEMAMKGIPVIVSGQTHYRNRGFTIDPDSWVNYFKSLGKVLEDPAKYRLSKSEIDNAWKYAYYFFFIYPQPYPWHLWGNKENYNRFPMKYIFSKEGEKQFGETFNYFLGKTIDWKRKTNHS